MIPAGQVAEWRQQAPWPQDLQVEQDLILSRALVELFNHPGVAQTLLLRGGTALFKVHIRRSFRYSEDIDLVQAVAEPAGPMLNAIREVLDPWLGKPKRKFSEGRITLLYRMRTEGPPQLPIRLKIEINTREHFSVFGAESYPFAVESRWFAGHTLVSSYRLEELLGTKLRALYQRKKGRDLFDLAIALQHAEVEPERIITAFSKYTEHNGAHVTQAEFERNLYAKIADPTFTGDLQPLLQPGINWSFEDGARIVRERILVLLPGDSWKGLTEPA